MSRRTRAYRPLLGTDRRVSLAFAPDAPWAPLTREEAQRQYEAGRVTSDYTAYYRFMGQVGIKTQVEAYRMIATGVAVFRYRCGGLHGPVHRVVISRAGAISFPDHMALDQGAADVLAVLSEAKSAPRCDEILAVLREPEERPRNWVRLWGAMAVLSDLPPWAQAVAWAMEARPKYRTARRPDEGLRNDRELAYRHMAELDIRQGMDLEGVGLKDIDVWSSAAGSVVRALPLSWPDGYHAYQVTGLVARHRGHKDGIVHVAPAPGSALFRRPEALMAFAYCPGEDTEEPVMASLRPAVLVPSEDGAGWRVEE